MKKIIVNANELEHLLNCMDNQKFIHEQSEETQKEWQEIIDQANRKMRKRMMEQKNYKEKKQFIGFFEIEGEDIEHVIITEQNTAEAVKKLNEHLEGKKLLLLGVSPFKSLEQIK